MIGILIIATILAAGGAITALAMGASWWVALLIYSFGGAVLTGAMTMLVSLRKDACDPALPMSSAAESQDSMVDTKISPKPHAETV